MEEVDVVKGEEGGVEDSVVEDEASSSLMVIVFVALVTPLLSVMVIVMTSFASLF